MHWPTFAAMSLLVGESESDLFLRLPASEHARIRERLRCGAERHERAEALARELAPVLREAGETTLEAFVRGGV